jgi:hypothetical protein
MKFEMYNPSPEEIQKAEEMMTSEQKAASEQREKEFFGGEEFGGGVESKVRKWGDNFVLKEAKSPEENNLPIAINTKEYLQQKETDYKELKNIFGDYLLDTEFFLAPSKNDPEKIVSYAAQRKIEGKTLSALREEQEKYLNDPAFRNQIKSIIWLTKKAFLERGLLIDLYAPNIMREEKSGRLFVVDPGSPTLVQEFLESPQGDVRERAQKYFRDKIETINRWEALLKLSEEEKEELNKEFGIDEKIYKEKIEQIGLDRIREETMIPEQRLASDLREKVLSEDFEIPEPISEQRKEELENEISNIAKIFNGYGRPWFIVGGIALELAEGKLTRDHQDSDIAIHYKDVADFFDYSRDLGYKFVDAEGKDISSKEDLISRRENAFLRKVDETKPGPKGFEIIFLRSNDKGEIIFGANEKLTFPAALYEGGQRYTAKNGQEVPLTPKEIQILYKIFEGRQKDLYDVKTFLPTLSQNERQRLNGYLESVGVTFVVGNRETENLDELLQLAETTAKETKENFLATKVDEVISKNRERFYNTIGKIFEIAGRVSSPENFLDEIKKEFGDYIIARRKTELDESAKFLFGNKKRTQEEFREFAYRTFNLPQYLERELKSAALDMRRWKIKTKMP